FGVAAPALAPAAGKRLQVGYTALVWSALPRSPENLEAALKDISELGFHSFETFAEVLETWETKGALGELIAKYKVPLKSGYQTVNVIDPAQKKETLERIIKRAHVIRKHGGSFMVLAPNSVRRAEYKFAEHKDHIISALNDYSKAMNDAGLGTGLHQHTGTAIDSEDEVYTVMRAVDTRHCKFAPDVGQLQKGGSDAAKVVKEFASILVHMHFKDFAGGQYFAGYSPLGEGKVDLAGIIDTMEKVSHPVDIMVELDPSPNAPITPRQTAETSKKFLVKLGYKFRT
ncbi:MAG: sugar phosphate isomerase/epimerase family protein, partial [Bryobacteraceae bacterium]